MYALASPWCSWVSAAVPVSFAWQAQHLVLSRGSDGRPGVALVQLGLRRCADVVGAVLGALQGWDVQ